MKIQNSKTKRNKTLIIILAIVVAVIVIAALVFGISLLVKNNPNMGSSNGNHETIVQGIVVNSAPKTEYYVDDEIDLTGLRIQIVTNKVGDLRFVDYPNDEMSVTGYDMSKSGEQVITVTYQSFTTTFKINVKEYAAPDPTLVSIEVCDLIDTYTVEKWNKNGANLYGAYLKLTYSDGTTKGSYEETPLLWDYVEPLQKVSGAGTTKMVIKYIEGGIEVSTTVTITITN